MFTAKRDHAEPTEYFHVGVTMYALVGSATELFRENWNDLAAGSLALKSTDSQSGSSHRLKDTQQIRDVVDRCSDAPIPIFLQEVGSIVSASSRTLPPPRRSLW
jgi:hypothetical protein